MRVSRDPAELKQMLIEQVELLQMASTNYDAGRKSAAKHLAVALRVLLHETRKSKGLLHQLGLRHIRFSEWNYTTFPRIRNGERYRPIRNDLTLEMDVMVGAGESARPTSIAIPVGPFCRLALPFTDRTKSEYVAPLSSQGVEIRKRFHQWWSDEVVRDKEGRSFSRRDLVLHVADTDGGAHVDPSLEANYLTFSRKNSLEWKFKPEGEEWKSIPGAHIACIRQIAHEVLETLRRSAPWALIEKYTFGNPTAEREGFTVGSLDLSVVKKRVRL